MSGGGALAAGKAMGSCTARNGRRPAPRRAAPRPSARLTKPAQWQAKGGDVAENGLWMRPLVGWRPSSCGARHAPCRARRVCHPRTAAGHPAAPVGAVDRPASPVMRWRPWSRCSKAARPRRRAAPCWRLRLGPLDAWRRPGRDPPARSTARPTPGGGGRIGAFGSLTYTMPPARFWTMVSIWTIAPRSKGRFSIHSSEAVPGAAYADARIEEAKFTIGKSAMTASPAPAQLAIRRFLTDEWPADVATDYSGKCTLVAAALRARCSTGALVARCAWWRPTGPPPHAAPCQIAWNISAEAAPRCSALPLGVSLPPTAPAVVRPKWLATFRCRLSSGPREH
jgi:hypothetical protein